MSGGSILTFAHQNNILGVLDCDILPVFDGNSLALKEEYRSLPHIVVQWLGYYIINGSTMSHALFIHSIGRLSLPVP